VGDNRRRKIVQYYRKCFVFVLEEPPFKSELTFTKKEGGVPHKISRYSASKSMYELYHKGYTFCRKYQFQINPLAPNCYKKYDIRTIKKE
jgi:hypothetical protein